MKIGVLALQGAVTEHIRSIERAGAEGIAGQTGSAIARTWMVLSFLAGKARRLVN